MTAYNDAKRKDERNRTMKECRACGMTLADIADMCGVTRERVRQIVGSARQGKHGPRYLNTLNNVMALWRKGFCTADIARAIGFTYSATADYLLEVGLTPHPAPRKRGPGPRTREVLEMFDSGMSIKEIVSRTNRHPPSVRTILSRYGRTVAKREEAGGPCDRRKLPKKETT